MHDAVLSRLGLEAEHEHSRYNSLIQKVET
jgi:hypothetical protein